jgi:hypothetical protein
MEQKQAITGRLASKYRGSAFKKKRSRILDEVQELTGYNRHYAAWLLRNYGKRRVVTDAQGQPAQLVVGKKNKRRAAKRRCIYDQAVRNEILFLWDCFDQMCGKRLVAMLPDLLPVLVQRSRIRTDEAIYEKLSRISAATVDRMLTEERKKRRLKGHTHTKPSSILKSQIPILISSELNRTVAGHYQIDLVGHEGGNPNGHFAFTLNAVELSSGWIEPQILLNKAHRWAKEAIGRIKILSPIPILSFHSDNDSSFLNEPLQRWCQEHHIHYTRARPYHCNDTCYVEQKNYNIVRQAVGYARVETEEEVTLIGSLYEKLRLLINFFYPSMKLLNKDRKGARIHKTYDKPKTPFRRLLDNPDVSTSIKIKLRHQKRQIDPLVLKTEITQLQGQLLELLRRKNMQILYPGPSYPGAMEKLKKRLYG